MRAKTIKYPHWIGWFCIVSQPYPFHFTAQVTPVSPWQYAIALDPQHPSASIRVFNPGYVEGAAPFNHTAWPVYLEATLRPLTTWRLEHGSAGEPPNAPACAPVGACKDSLRVNLVPYGGTDLRITEMSLA